MQEKYIHPRVIKELTVRFLDENMNIKHEARPYRYYICFDLKRSKKDDLKLADFNMVGYILENVHAKYLNGGGNTIYDNPMIIEKECIVSNFNSLMVNSLKFISSFSVEWFNSQYPNKYYDKIYNHKTYFNYNFQDYIRYIPEAVLPPETIRNNYSYCGFLTEFNGYAFVENKEKFICDDGAQYIIFKNGKGIYNNKE